MIPVSPAARIAWQVAVHEALLARSEFVEREHLLIGIYSLEKLISPDAFQRNAGAARGLLEEKDALLYLLRNSGLDATGLRRQVRQALPHGSFTRQGRTIHRSKACRQCFVRAGQLSGGKEVSCIHLFHAILEDPGPVIQGVMDHAAAASRPAGGEATPGPGQMVQSVRDYQTVQERKSRLAGEIGLCRTTLTSMSRNSEEYLRLKRNLVAKTVQLALICLDVRDGTGLIHAMEELLPDSGDLRQEMMGVLAQLRYMQGEGISVGGRSQDRVRGILLALEKAAGRGGQA